MENAGLNCGIAKIKMPRTAAIHRKTNETDIRLKLNLDGRGNARIATGIRFFDHMLELVVRHGAFDLTVDALGDLDVDQHHTVEDVGITLGEAIAKALGSKRGILRAGYFLMPMDETLAAAAIDFSGRAHCVCAWRFGAQRVGDMQTELVEDFFRGFAQAAGANVHLRLHYGVAWVWCSPSAAACPFIAATKRSVPTVSTASASAASLALTVSSPVRSSATVIRSPAFRYILVSSPD